MKPFGMLKITGMRRAIDYHKPASADFPFQGVPVLKWGYRILPTPTPNTSKAFDNFPDYIAVCRAPKIIHDRFHRLHLVLEVIYIDILIDPLANL